MALGQGRRTCLRDKKKKKKKKNLLLRGTLGGRSPRKPGIRGIVKEGSIFFRKDELKDLPEGKEEKEIWRALFPASLPDLP